MLKVQVIAVLVVAFLGSGCGNAAPKEGVIDKAQGRVAKVEDQANAAAMSAELTTAFRMMHGSCQATKVDCPEYDALKPLLSRCQNKKRAACEMLRTKLEELK